MLKSKKGITLVELLVVLALLVIIAPFTTNLLLMISRDYNTSAKFVRQMDKVNEASYRLSYDIGEAHKVYQLQNKDNTGVLVAVNEIVLKTMVKKGDNEASDTEVEYSKCWKMVGDELRYCKVNSDITIDHSDDKLKYFKSPADTTMTELTDDDYVTVVDNLDTSSLFSLVGNVLYVMLQPITDNNDIQTNRNVNIPAILRFRVDEKLDHGLM